MEYANITKYMNTAIISVQKVTFYQVLVSQLVALLLLCDLYLPRLKIIMSYGYYAFNAGMCMY